MKFFTEYLTFETAKLREYLKITPQVQRVLEKSGIQEGMILVSAMHITAGIWVGPWQEVYYAEFDGRRPKRVIIKAMGE